MSSSTSRSFVLFGSESSPFLLDLRAIGLFRVLLALVILLDQIVRLDDWHAFHSAFGVVSLDDSRAWKTPWLWSVYWLSDGPLLPYVLEALRFLATMTLMFGIRSRLSAFVLFVLMASVAARNPLLLQGGDKVQIVMTFFAIFLPLGQRGSLEGLWFGQKPDIAFRSAATVAYVIQVLLVWFMAGILKTGEQWWSTGTAISMALHLEAFATEFARLWRGWDWLIQPFTFFVFWLECLAPLLALVPVYWCRLVGLLALVALEVGIWANLEVGLFPLISVVSLVPLFPSRFVDLVSRRWPGSGGSKGADLVLFFDRGCRFCAFACRLLMAVCGIRRAAGLREAQSDPVAARILQDSFAWSVTRVRNSQGDSPEISCAELDPEYRQGWDAVLFVVRHSPRPWLVRVLPGPALGDRLYAWIGRHRGAMGAAGGICFGRNSTGMQHGEVGRLMASMALMTVLAWNVAAYPAVREWKDLRPLVTPLIATFNLVQHWSMFAPIPYAFDHWHVMPALARDGSTVELLSGLPLRLEPPRDGPDHYGGYRWRKTIIRSLQIDGIDRVLSYFCRTGKWVAIDVWEFRRPNPGVAATADSPYDLVNLERWQCGGVDQSGVDEFRAEIDAVMDVYTGASVDGGSDSGPRT